MPTKTITAKELHQRHEAGESVCLIDVRTPVEYREVHVPFAKNVPFNRLSPREVGALGNGNQPTYVICQVGRRAQQACQKLAGAGLQDVVNVEGGTLAWESAGLPVVRGKRAFALERQVRIAAGSLVLVGAVLGFFVSPYWIALPAFIGAGLVFAGVTDTCGMGMVLARMPWNQIRDSGAECTPNPSQA